MPPYPHPGRCQPQGTGRTAAAPLRGTGHQHWQGFAFACQKGFEGGPSEPGKRGYFFFQARHIFLPRALLSLRDMHQAGWKCHLLDLHSATLQVFHVPTLPPSLALSFCPNKGSGSFLHTSFLRRWMIGGCLPSTCCLTETEASQSPAPQNLMAHVEVGKISHHPIGISGPGMGRTGNPNKKGDKMSCQGTRSP